AALPGIDIVETLDDLLARRPSVVAEVAGQGAVKEYGAEVLRRGTDLLVISIGALAEPKLLEALKTAAQSGGRLLLPAGAIGGIDATEVELVADPEAPGNVHEIEAEGAAGRFAIQLQGKPSRTNPKTSALAALSVARALLNLETSIVI